MRKQIIYTILSGLLCTSGFGQKVQIPGEVPLVDLQSTVGFVASLAALAEITKTQGRTSPNQREWRDGQTTAALRDRAYWTLCQVVGTNGMFGRCLCGDCRTARAFFSFPG